MAQASAKKLAQANVAALQQLHTVTAGVFVVVMALQWLFGRPLKGSIFMCLPMFGFQYVLEKSSRPKYNGKELKSAGTDLSQGGLTEYMHDVIYFTWILLVLSLFTLKVWWLYLLVPAFAAYKAVQLLKAGKQLLTGGAKPQQAQPVEATSASTAQPEQTEAPAPQNRRQRRARV